MKTRFAPLAFGVIGFVASGCWQGGSHRNPSFADNLAARPTLLMDAMDCYVDANAVAAGTPVARTTTYGAQASVALTTRVRSLGKTTPPLHSSACTPLFARGALDGDVWTQPEAPPGIAILAKKYSAKSVLVTAVANKMTCTDDAVDIGTQQIKTGLANCKENELDLVAYLFDDKGTVLWKGHQGLGVGHATPDLESGVEKLMAQLPSLTAARPVEVDALAVQEPGTELVGRWMPTLPSDQWRALAITRCALAGVWRRDTFDRLAPTPKEREQYDMVVRLVATDAGSSELAALRRKVSEYEEFDIEITPSTIHWRGPGVDSNETYKVGGRTDDGLTLNTNRESIAVRIRDRDHVEMRGTTRTMSLTRRTPGTEPCGAGDDAASPVVRPDSPTSSAPADACALYATCIDQMPRRDGDQRVMGTSSRLIRSWERTPDRLEQCEKALRAARSGGLCP